MNTMMVSLSCIYSNDENIKSYLTSLGYSFTSVSNILKYYLGIKVNSVNIGSGALYEPLCYRFDEDFQRILDYIKQLLDKSKETGERITLRSFYGWGLKPDPYYGFLSEYRATHIFRTRLKMYLRDQGIISKNHGIYYERYHYLP